MFSYFVTREYRNIKIINSYARQAVSKYQY